MADEAKPAAAPAPAAPAKAAEPVDPMAAVMTYIEGEMSEDGFAHAKTIAGDAGAFLKHLESHLPMASFGKVQAMLGLDL